jgi:acyl-coenzyme A thioesterase PaaI-like protein
MTQADWCPSAAWEGFRNIIHGGVVSTVLDEAMCKAIAAAGYRGVTCDLRVRLRLHVQPGEELRIEGWEVEKRRRRIVAEARLTALDGTEKAHAWATFLEV